MFARLVTLLNDRTQNCYINVKWLGYDGMSYVVEKVAMAGVYF